MNSSAAPGQPTSRIGLVTALVGVISNPGQFFGSLPERARGLTDVVFFTLITAFQIGLVGVVAASELEQGWVSTIALAFLGGAAVAVPQLLISAGVIHLIAGWLGGRAEFAMTRRAFAYGAAPTLLAAIPVLGWVAAIWGLVLQIMGIAIVHGLSRIRATLSFLSLIVLSVCVSVGLRTWVLEAFKMPSGSMYPTLQIGDHFFVSKGSYGWLSKSVPRRGDVIAFEWPGYPSGSEPVDFVKRVIALPGDVLEVDDGHAIINGWRVPNCHVGTIQMSEDATSEVFVEFLDGASYLIIIEDRGIPRKEGPYTVPEGEVYVMGDNRRNSLDSRAWNDRRGAGVPFSQIKGRAEWLWWPISRLGMSVSGAPQMPELDDDSLEQSLARCLDQAPEVEESSPPAGG